MTAIGPMTSAGPGQASNRAPPRAAHTQRSASQRLYPIQARWRRIRADPRDMSRLQGSGVGTRNRATAAIKQRLLRADLEYPQRLQRFNQELVRDRCSADPEPSDSARPVGRLLIVLRPHTTSTSRHHSRKRIKLYICPDVTPRDRIEIRYPHKKVQRTRLSH
jgi:hypothetical protein